VAASHACASTERGRPTEREIFGPSRLGKGAWPDGIAFDSYGLEELKKASALAGEDIDSKKDRLDFSDN